VGIAVEWAAQPNVPPELAEATELDARFADLVERQARFMFKVAHGLLRNQHDAEDAVQEAMLKLYRTGAWLHMQDEKAFLARTVWRVAVDIAARRRNGTEDATDADLACSSAGPEQLVDEGDQRALVRELIDNLSDDLRQPLILCAIEEMTSREVAVMLGLTEGAVRTRVMRARAELRRRFEALQRRIPASPQERAL
jgi:RNA polymerase sigma-70 factor (ECF subfamily)